MTEFTPYTPLKMWVSATLDELQRSNADFDRYWVLCVRALVDMTYQVSGEPVTLRLPVSGNKTVAFPKNCLSWSKIGLVNESGEVELLRIKKSLTTFKSLSPDRLSDLAGDVVDGVNPSGSLFQNYFYQGGCYQLFGVGGGMMAHGECSVDEKARVVILPPDFAYDSILFECIDVPEQNGDYQIPTCLGEAVVAFIKWKDKQGPREEYYAAVTSGRRALPRKKVILQSVLQLVRGADAQKLRS